MAERMLREEQAIRWLMIVDSWCAATADADVTACTVSAVRRLQGGAGCAVRGAKPLLQEATIGLQGLAAIFSHLGDQPSDILFN